MVNNICWLLVLLVLRRILPCFLPCPTHEKVKYVLIQLAYRVCIVLIFSLFSHFYCIPIVFPLCFPSLFCVVHSVLMSFIEARVDTYSVPPNKTITQKCHSSVILAVIYLFICLFNLMAWFCILYSINYFGLGVWLSSFKMCKKRHWRTENFSYLIVICEVFQFSFFPYHILLILPVQWENENLPFETFRDKKNWHRKRITK